MTFLSVNINKVATLRNSRGKNTPNLVKMAEHLIDLGVKGLTVHPRPDERHIKKTDVYDLNEFIKSKTDIEFNIEGYPSQDFTKLINDIEPHQCTLVPDPPETLTSNAGWDLEGTEAILSLSMDSFSSRKTRTSLFIDPTQFSDSQFEILKKLSPERVEFYTEPYADNYNSPTRNYIVDKYSFWADKIHSIGIGINAGHDLNQTNLEFFLKNVPHITEVSIGHAIFSEALYLGIDKVISGYQKICDAE